MYWLENVDDSNTQFCHLQYYSLLKKYEEFVELFDPPLKITFHGFLIHFRRPPYTLSNFIGSITPDSTMFHTSENSLPAIVKSTNVSAKTSSASEKHARARICQNNFRRKRLKIRLGEFAISISLSLSYNVHFDICRKTNVCYKV